MQDVLVPVRKVNRVLARKRDAERGLEECRMSWSGTGMVSEVLWFWGEMLS